MLHHQRRQIRVKHPLLHGADGCKHGLLAGTCIITGPRWAVPHLVHVGAELLPRHQPLGTEISAEVKGAIIGGRPLSLRREGNTFWLLQGSTKLVQEECVNTMASAMICGPRHRATGFLVVPPGDFPASRTRARGMGGWAKKRTKV